MKSWSWAKETGSKIRNVFYNLYKEKLESAGVVDFQVLFASFYKAIEELAQTDDVDLVYTGLGFSDQ